jgi:hypothetical protein
VFTAAPAFERGAAAFRKSAEFVGMSPQDQAEAGRVLDSLRQKLGFGRPAEPPGEGAPAPTVADRHFSRGDEVSVVHRGRPADQQATIVRADAEEVFVESDVPPDSVQPGETWLVRYPSGGMVWEFDATVLRTEGRRVVLSRPVRFRFINRRRFPRVPTSKPAKVADFVGIKSADGEGLPQFVPGEVVEIAGPGMQVVTELRASAGQNVLAVVRLGEGNLVEALGKVRRVVDGEEGTPVLAIELVGLNSDEVAELVKATNLAAQHTDAGQEDSAAEGEPQAAKEQK